MTEDAEFEVSFTVTAVLKLNPAVIQQVDKEWRETFYNLKTPEEIAEHIAYNLIQGSKLSQLDGFADLPDDYAVFEDEPNYSVDYVEGAEQ